MNRETALRLAQLMSDLSEECYSAGWLIGWEHALWRVLQANEGQDEPCGLGVLRASAIDEVRRLSVEAGVWICMVDKPDFCGLISKEVVAELGGVLLAEDPTDPFDDWADTYMVPLAAWARWEEAREARARARRGGGAGADAGVAAVGDVGGGNG